MSKSLDNLQKKKLLSPKIDIVFQSLFNQANEKITKSFVESLLEEKIEKIKINEMKELYREKLDEKLGILDLELDVNNNEKVDVEIQLVNNKNLEDRILYYFSRLYASSVKIGEDYTKAKRTLIIVIIDYEFEKTKEIKEMETRWKIMCKNEPKLELTNKMEVIIIELKKMRRSYISNKDNKKNQWLMFLDNPNSKEVERIMKKNENIKEAVIEVHKMSKDERMQKLAELREKAIMDEKAYFKSGMSVGLAQGLERGIKEGIEQGLERGIKEGMEQGTKSAKLEIAKKMKKEGISVGIIKKITELTEEEINSF